MRRDSQPWLFGDTSEQFAASQHNERCELREEVSPPPASTCPMSAETRQMQWGSLQLAIREQGGGRRSSKRRRFRKEPPVRQNPGPATIERCDQPSARMRTLS